MCIIEKIIKNKNTFFHSYMIYDEERKCFNMKSFNSKQSGIYIIVEQDPDTRKLSIHKVGMADGNKGLAGRLKCYSTKNVIEGNKGDLTTRMIHRVMTSELKDTLLLMYIHPIEHEYTSYCGINNIKKPLVNVRDFERMVSTQAAAEGHPMKLSSQH